MHSFPFVLDPSFSDFLFSSTMKFLFVLTALSAVAYASAASVGSFSFNNLLGSENLIPAHLDEVQTKSGDSSSVLSQLKVMLDDSEIMSQIFSNYKATYGQPEPTNPTVAFTENLLSIAKHNLEFEQGLHSWSKGVNHFTVLSKDEFNNKFTGLVVANSTGPSGSLPMPLTSPTLTSFIGQSNALDWRNSGAVTPIKDQQTCGSCVTFATNAIVESTMILRRKTTLDLSEQELLSCTTENNGCRGGWYTYSLNYVKTYGVASEQTYPYVNDDNGKNCERSTRSARAIDAGVGQWYDYQPNGSDGKLKQGITDYGPMAVAVGTTDDWSSYRSGIYDGSCAGNVNHAVAVVGYGSENGQDYWIVKNSWNTWWGENGYMRLARGSNKCLVSQYGFLAYV